jgi:hypothetical protein
MTCWRSLSVATCLAVLAVVVLLGVLRLLPEGSISFDMHSWLAVASLLHQEKNPYNETNLLNWPPLWMQLLYLFDHVSQLTHVRLLRVIQLFLIIVDAVVAAITYLLLARHWRIRGSLLIAVIGILLNPVAIILIDIHGNFDVVIGLLVTLFLWAITSWRRSGESESWLFACLILGIGGLTKTVPLILAPLLMTGWRQLNPRLGALGLALLLGPVTVGMSVIYVLGPQQVTAHVLQYRSIAGTFGPTGLIHALNVPISDRGYSVAFELFLVTLLLLVLLRVVTRAVSETDLVLMTALLLLLVPVLGPGYGPQYAWWWIPVLVVAYALEGRWLRIPLLALFVIAAVTYVVDYALVPTLGGGVLVVDHPAALGGWSRALDTLSGETLLRLPLFGAYVVVLLAGTIHLSRAYRTSIGPAASRGEAPQMPSR